MVLIHINMEKKTDQTETDVMNNYISRRDLEYSRNTDIFPAKTSSQIWYITYYIWSNYFSAVLLYHLHFLTKKCCIFCLSVYEEFLVIGVELLHFCGGCLIFAHSQVPIIYLLTDLLEEETENYKGTVVQDTWARSAATHFFVVKRRHRRLCHCKSLFKGHV